jgi:hypothetical protein
MYLDLPDFFFFEIAPVASSGRTAAQASAMGWPVRIAVGLAGDLPGRRAVAGGHGGERGEDGGAAAGGERDTPLGDRLGRLGGYGPRDLVLRRKGPRMLARFGTRLTHDFSLRPESRLSSADVGGVWLILR